ncbi:MAG: 2-oxoglutarate dehydrogenase complex dihydrolipoyllysine-residue succinyltransferase [Bacteroidota bacterium]
MAFEVTVPSPGESISEVIIDSWLKEDGDFVEADEPIAEIQSDKAMLTLYAEKSGKLSIKVEAGEEVEVGAVVALIDTDAEGGGSDDGAADAQSEDKGEESSDSKAAATASAKAESKSDEDDGEEDGAAAGQPSPAARRILEDNDISPEDVKGTGRGGRITKEDAQKAVEAKQSGQSAEKKEEKKAEDKAKPSKPQTPELDIQAPKTGATREQRRKKMTSLRRTLAKRLVSVKNETAMLTTFQEIDMSAVINTRKKYKQKFEDKHGIRLGFMGFFTKAVANALMEFPEVNAYIDGNEIVYNDYVDMGIAVSSDRGLMVPVIRNAESLTLYQIESEVSRLAERARDGKVSLEEMTGGTYTITNGGVFGSLMSTPILNPPQSAILGMHRTEERPVVVNGEIVIRPMMYLAMSYDHRIIDGKESVTFLYKVKEYLEDPVRMLLEV